MAGDDEEWRLRLAAAAETAAAALRQLDDPHVRALLRDVETLRARLLGEDRGDGGADAET